MTQLIESTLENGVRRLKINRADKRNALNGPMYEAITDALRDAEQNPAVAVVLIHGVDGCFTAGNDLGDFLAGQDTTGARPAHGLIRALAEATVPLIAAVDGPAVGIGTTLLLHCDFVYATPEAKFSLPFVNLGVCPEAGSSLLLPRLVGYLRAAELLLLGEPFDGNTAHTMGLVSALCAPEELLATAQGTANRLAKKPREALRASKALMKRPEEPIATRVDVEIAHFSALLAKPAAREIMTAFVEKRAPDPARYA